jgi:ATP-dependent Zn protease
MIEQAYQRTKAILREHRVELEQLAKLLLVKEVVGRAELEGIFGIRSNNGKSILQES